MNTIIINLTPHSITLHTPCRGGIDDHEHAVFCGCPGRDGVWDEFEPSGEVARVEMVSSVVREVWGADVVSQIPGEVQDLPDPEPNTFFIVSRLVLDACRDRFDLLAPDTGPTAGRDDKGQIQWVCRFIGNDPE